VSLDFFIAVDVVFEGFELLVELGDFRGARTGRVDVVHLLSF
jgi:hypothetical protein